MFIGLVTLFIFAWIICGRIDDNARENAILRYHLSEEGQQAKRDYDECMAFVGPTEEELAECRENKAKKEAPSKPVVGTKDVVADVPKIRKSYDTLVVNTQQLQERFPAYTLQEIKVICYADSLESAMNKAQLFRPSVLSIPATASRHRYVVDTREVGETTGRERR